MPSLRALRSSVLASITCVVAHAGSSPYRSAVFTLGAKIATPANVWQCNGGCVPAVVEAADDSATTPVAPTELVAVTTTTE